MPNQCISIDSKVANDDVIYRNARIECDLNIVLLGLFEERRIYRVRRLAQV